MTPASIVALALGAVPQPTGAAVQQQLREVFDRPEFAPQQDPFWQRWLVDAVQAFFGWLGGLYDASPALFWLLLVGCCVLLLMLLAHIAWAVRSVWYAGVRPGAAARTAAAREALSLRFHAEAERRVEAADFTEAIRCLFLALVYRFDESGRVDFQAASTNREYLALVAERPQVQAGLRVFVDALDERWYGQRPSARAEYERCRALYDELTSA